MLIPDNHRWRRQPMLSFGNNFRKFMDDAWGGLEASDVGMRDIVPLDMFEDGDNLVVQASVPGIDPKNMLVTVEDGVLSISGKFEETPTDEGDEVPTSSRNYLMQECRLGSFHRAVRLPTTVDVDRSETTYKNGVLEVKFPNNNTKARELQINIKG